MKTKYCGTCERFLLRNRFSPDKSNGDGLYSNCKDCRNAWTKKYRKQPRVKRSWQNSLLKKKYGIGIKEQKALLKSQNGKCAICKSSRPGGKYNKWQTDHNHTTKITRGLLCFSCNSAIGLFKDSPKILLSALSYLCLGEVKCEL